MHEVARYVLSLFLQILHSSHVFSTGAGLYVGYINPASSLNHA